MKLTGFQGFPTGEMHSVLMPQPFFSELLPVIDDLAELKLTLYMFFLLQTETYANHWIMEDRLLNDSVLLGMVAETSNLYEPAVLLEAALERALIRNTLLPLEIKTEECTEIRKAYVLNTENGRKARQQALHALQSDSQIPTSPNDKSLPFRYYHQNFGLLTPLVADQIRDLEREFAADWICEAMEIAVHNNAKSLRYVEAVLDRWASEGRTDG